MTNNNSATGCNTPSRRRLPAEWENHECVLLAWPHEQTDWAYILPEARRCIAEIIKAITDGGECVALIGPSDLCQHSVSEQGFDPLRVRFIDIPTNDTWARDFGPIGIESDGTIRLLDFKFNGWGLKFAADKDNLITSRLQSLGELKAGTENRLNFVLEGGSIESDGKGTILTTAECLLSPNRNGQWTHSEIASYLTDAFGASHILFLNHGALTGDDTDSHIDTLARLAPDDTIVYCGSGSQDNPNHDGLVKMREELTSLRTPDGRPFNLIELPLPDVIEIDGEILPATYANFLITPKRILMPTYRQPQNDQQALQTIKAAFPGHEIIGIDCTTLVRQHGSLHCVTMQLPPGSMSGISNATWKQAD